MFDSDKDFLEKASDSFKSNLMPDDLIKIAEEPHWRRAIFLLERGNLNETEIAKTLASLANLESIKDFEISQDATKILPLRLINEYHCLTTSDGKIAISWVPTKEMNK